jgi:hypothetical protein
MGFKKTSLRIPPNIQQHARGLGSILSMRTKRNIQQENNITFTCLTIRIKICEHGLLLH